MSETASSLTDPDFGGALSAYERASLGGNDPRCIPIRKTQPLPVGSEIIAPTYTETEQETWQTLIQRQNQILPSRASGAYLSGLKHLHLPLDHVPTLAELSLTLEACSGWRVSRTPGLLHEEDFFIELSQRIFPSTDYIREPHELDYTPAPDLFHDIYGHMPILLEPDFADFYQEFGEVALRSQSNSIERRGLERFYWFTAEFGLIREAGELKIYGNGIVSSYQETLHALTDKVEHRPFDPYAMAMQDYDIWHLQPILYVIESYEELKQGFRDLARRFGLL